MLQFISAALDFLQNTKNTAAVQTGPVDFIEVSLQETLVEIKVTERGELFCFQKASVSLHVFSMRLMFIPV